MKKSLRIKIGLPIATLAAILPLSVTRAEVNDGVQKDEQGWYVGIEGGMPFGFSTFSSFGHDKTRLGWDAGFYGGYRFNNIWSAELSAKYGEMNLAAQDCCAERNYWLGSDGTIYKASVLGMDCWEYTQLKSQVRMAQLGARVNINLLALFPQTANSRWEVAASPHLYAVTTKADIQNLTDGTTVKKGATNWHLGYGADLQVGYRLNDRLKLGIFSGLPRLSGKRLDGMPEYLHKNNYVWESGIRLGISLTKQKKNNADESPLIPNQQMIQHQVTQQETANKVNMDKQKTANKAETKVVEQGMAEQKKVNFPIIYFDFNRTDINQSEESKLDDILRTLKENPNMKVTITGWCDTIGSKAANRHISRQRAEGVKRWLTKKGIKASRISAVGNGSDESLDAEKARRVETSDRQKQ